MHSGLFLSFELPLKQGKKEDHGARGEAREGDGREFVRIICKGEGGDAFSFFHELWGKGEKGGDRGGAKHALNELGEKVGS